MDSWLLYRRVRGHNHLSQNDYYCTLAESLVNMYSEDRILRSNTANNDTDQCVSHLISTSRRRKGSINAFFQGRCNVCVSKKSKFICKECMEQKKEEVFLCFGSTGRSCHENHDRACHKQNKEGDVL